MDTLQDRDRFIDYLSSLAVEGETALFTWRKPTLDEAGQPMLYGDGTVKTTWPPMSPAKAKQKPEGTPLYGNTGSFVEDRLKENWGAKAANCDYVLVMVLDDIGSKVTKNIPLEPTWKMETTPENYQYGYVFSEQPTKGDFSSLIDALANKRYTDKGARGVVRNFRLPNSPSMKVGTDGFKARLIEFNPGREFTMAEICKAFKVKPETGTYQEFKPLKARKGDDEVFSWLKERGLVIEEPNGDGWAQVVCPNCASHGDPTDVMAKYKPSDRGFACYHEHCQDWNSKRFLDWVAEQGGPAAVHAVNEEDESDSFSRLAAILPKERPEMSELMKMGEQEQEQKAQVAKVQQKEREQELTAEAIRVGWYQRYIYLVADDQYFDTVDKVVLKKQSFDALWRHIPCTSAFFNGKLPRIIPPSTWFDENREVNGGLACWKVTYAPGEAELVTFEGQTRANTWRDARIKVDKLREVDVNPWLQHMHRLFGDATYVDHILDMMAFKVQNPGIKINHALMVTGVEGNGKDTAFLPFLAAVGGLKGDNNISTINGKINAGDWGDHLESEILIFNELKEGTSGERRALANELKPLIAAPPEYLPINKKFQTLYKVLNRLMLIAFSNEMNPLSLSSGDRRWVVFHTVLEPQEEGYYQGLYRWFGRNGHQGLKDCATFLHQRDVSGFNPKATPMMTEAKQDMLDSGRSEAEGWVISLIQGGNPLFQFGVLAKPFYSAAALLTDEAPRHITVRNQTVEEALIEAGWKRVPGRIKSAQNPSAKTVYASPEVWEEYQAHLRNAHVGLKPAELRDRAALADDFVIDGGGYAGK
jgi:hypothetical protein